MASYDESELEVVLKNSVRHVSGFDVALRCTVQTR